MTQIEIADEYRVLVIEFGEEIIEARWRGAHYVNYYANGEEFACAWQHDQITDEETFRTFVLRNLPYHLGIGDEAEED